MRRRFEVKTINHMSFLSTLFLVFSCPYSIYRPYLFYLLVSSFCVFSSLLNLMSFSCPHVIISFSILCCGTSFHVLLVPLNVFPRPSHVLPMSFSFQLHSICNLHTSIILIMSFSCPSHVLPMSIKYRQWNNSFGL